MKLKATRIKIEFDYEFLDGEKATFEYLSPTSKMIDKALTIKADDVTAQLDYTKATLKECLRGDEEAIDKMIDEQENESNIYEFKGLLDEELGKQKKRK